ncbi:hypothetical protein B0J12DRAFT_705696 [Macrophomina phaseolina]|uniref:Uncharacterized protein n=1 Tax=Macrophomina phaseolina TaxID=35725 RepID=A0ABQ8FRD4_9PEZI|nr:hypothetical protein B0J12DRAFT_705696 [Macrophomina phaseolina]
MEAHATYADARRSAASSSIYAAAISESSQVALHAVPESWPKDEFPLTGLIETEKHAFNRSNSNENAEGHCAALPQATTDAVADTPVPFEWDFITAGLKLPHYEMDCFESISYCGQEVRRENPLIKALFGLAKRLFEEVQNLEPGLVLEGLPRLKIIPSKKGQEAMAQAGKQLTDHHHVDDARAEDCSTDPHNIDAKSLLDTEAVRQDERKEAPGAETHTRKHQAGSTYLEIKRCLDFGSHFRTSFSESNTQTTSIEINPSADYELRTIIVPIKCFPTFWTGYKSRTVRIGDGQHEFFRDQLPRAAEYLQMLLELRDLADRHYAGCNYELHAKFPEQLVVTFLLDPNGYWAETEADTDVEELRADPNRSMGSLSPYQPKRVTEVVLPGVPISSDSLVQRQRQGTPYPRCENSDSNEENRSGLTRSRKRQSETSGSDQDRKRRKMQMGASLEDPVDLTGDGGSDWNGNDAV